MERHHGRRELVAGGAAVVLVLVLVLCQAACFSVHQLKQGREPGQDVCVAAVLTMRLGTVLLNGKELQSQPGVEDGLMAVYQPEGDLQTPLIRLLETCGCSLQRDAAGLLLVVPFSGCSMVVESNLHVSTVIWRESPVALICPVPMTLASAASTGLGQKREPLDAGSNSPQRRRRHTPLIPSAGPSSRSIQSLFSSSLKPFAVQKAKRASFKRPSILNPLHRAGSPSLPLHIPRFYQNPSPPFQTPRFHTRILGTSFYPRFAFNDFLNPAVPPRPGPAFPKVYDSPVIQLYFGRNPHQTMTTETPPTQPRHTPPPPPIRHCYPGQKCPFVPYEKDRFQPYVSFVSS